MRFVTSGGLAAGAISALVSTAVIADSVEQVVVTAARVEQPISEVIGSVSVITRDDIERRLVQSTQDVLRGETGVNVVNNGGLGKLSNVFLRGADSEQVLVLIDGVRIGSATAGTTAFEFLPLDQIERIEIVRGPRSSLYGADAIGGVIQIFTRQTNGASAALGVGSHNTFEANARFGHMSDDAWFSVSAGRLQTDGFNACRGAPFPPGGGCFTFEPDADGYDQTSGGARAGYAFGDRGEVEASASYASGTTEFDGDFANVSDYTQQVLTLRGRTHPAERWSVSLLMGDARDEQASFHESGGASLYAGRFDTVKRSASLQSDLQIAPGQLATLGIDYLQDRVESTTAFDETSRENVGVFAQHQARFGAHNVLVSVRHDDNEQFGGYDAGNVGWRWTLSPALALTAAWGSAFGAPTFNDLYYPGYSNPELEPESAQSVEIGAQGVLGAMRWSLAAYENRIDDLIVYDSRIFAPNNLNEARIRGVEVDGNFALQSWTIALGYAGMDPRNRTPGESYDNILPRRARHSGHIEAGRAIGPVEARMRVTAESSRYDNLANTQRVGGYVVVDVVADYAINREWKLQGRIGNAFGREYQTVRLYNQDERTFFLNLQYQPR
ncbi:MAG TPA: TonB-dependent receptor [Steroidobacter sp.]|jgi:vitamin B12 transporter|nr:TonB-dependent receptor [Steroidobacter sp.]